MIRLTSSFYLRVSIVAAVLLSGCAGSRITPVGDTYHNTTAHYNAYFYANERINEVERSVMNKGDKNYNRILPVFPKLDSTTFKAHETVIEDVIKKASIAIQRHENSKWVDDSYITVGKARFFSLDYANAVETFKYINVKSKDKPTRHLALVWLFRTFVEANEFDNATAVADYLDREDLNKANRHLLFMAKAHFYQLSGDLNNMVKNLVLAVPLATDHDERAKIYFIIGQVYQQLKFDALAYENYRSCLENNPPYELSFYAKLNMASVTQLSNNDDLKTVRRYFRKLLKDEKNIEFRDKIYYELANFELKQGNYEEAIQSYNSSVKASTANPRQKGYSYLKLAEVYYQHFKKYKTAQNYYDSTLSVLPKDEPEYDALVQRLEILTAFVEQVTIIETQDSLLKLANMPEAELDAYLDNYIAEKAREAEEEKEISDTKKKRQGNAAVDFVGTGKSIPVGQQQGSWYFYSTSAVAQGRQEFARKWGSRPLEDNWRRSVKQGLISSAPRGSDQSAADQEMGEEASVASISKEDLIATLPKTPEAQTAALAQVEEAYFKLGNIYNFQLLEKENAGSTFHTFVERFPDSEHAPEALYLLYLIYKELDSAIFSNYEKLLVSRFPQSIYAKLVVNPRYREESSLASAKLQKLYASAYAYYQQGEYEKARQMTSEGLREYPDNDFTDNMKLLDVMLVAKLDDVYKYQFELNNFITTYSESELIPYAQTLVKAYDDFQLNLVNSARARFKTDLDQLHFFIVLYPPDGKLPDELPGKIDDYIKTTLQVEGLTIGNLILDARRSMILINSFPGKSEARAFYDLFNNKNTLFDEYGTIKFYNFVITRENFNVFYQTKDLEAYLTFFNNNY